MDTSTLYQNRRFLRKLIRLVEWNLITLMIYSSRKIGRHWNLDWFIAASISILLRLNARNQPLTCRDLGLGTFTAADSTKDDEAFGQHLQDGQLEESKDNNHTME
jgi:hypothetical protein